MVPSTQCLLVGRISEAPSSGAFAVLCGALDTKHADHPKGKSWSAGMLNLPVNYRDSRRVHLGRVGLPPKVITAFDEEGEGLLEDHIFVGSDVDVIETLPLPFGSKAEAKAFGPLPSEEYPCAHLAVGAVVSFIAHVEID
jgi:hypothetical protein